MRDVHKWKDKVEFSLDNRQIFFLFFGLSVVGCFVFALGVMVGRRGDDAPKIARAEQDALGLLAGVEQTTPAEPAQQVGFSFKDGLAQSGAANLPATRDPEVPPQHDKVKAKVEPKKSAKAEKPSKSQPLLASKDKPKKSVSKPLPAALPKPPAAKPAAKPAVKPAVKPAAKPASKPAAKPAEDVVHASAKPQAAVKKPTSAAGFTLQMKAFANQADADKLADKLRRNGHDVRVETADVRGRLWYRVRVGSFKKWDDALSAKKQFEESESLIAYVVRN